MSKPDLLSDLKNVSEKDRKQIERAKEMLGPDPGRIGVVKNVFWGNFRDDLLFPYPEVVWCKYSAVLQATATTVAQTHARLPHAPREHHAEASWRTSTCGKSTSVCAT